MGYLLPRDTRGNKSVPMNWTNLFCLFHNLSTCLREVALLRINLCLGKFYLMGNNKKNKLNKKKLGLFFNILFALQFKIQIDKYRLEVKNLNILTWKEKFTKKIKRNRTSNMLWSCSV